MYSLPLTVLSIFVKKVSKYQEVQRKYVLLACTCRRTHHRTEVIGDLCDLVEIALSQKIRRQRKGATFLKMISIKRLSVIFTLFSQNSTKPLSKPKQSVDAVNSIAIFIGLSNLYCQKLYQYIGAVSRSLCVSSCDTRKKIRLIHSQ